MRSAEALVFFDDGVHGLNDGGLEALLFKDMHALDRCAAGRGDLVDQRHRVLAGFLAELCRAECRLAGDFLRERTGKPRFTPAEESASIYICTNAPEAPPERGKLRKTCASGIS